jgi:hypothetical protein
LQGELRRSLRVGDNFFWLGLGQFAISCLSSYSRAFSVARVEWRGQYYGVAADKTLACYE